MKISLTYPSEQKIKPKKCKGGDSKSEIKNVLAVMIKYFHRRNWIEIERRHETGPKLFAGNSFFLHF
jgi:hypothetical protein